MPGYKSLEVVVADGVAEVHLCRPELLNCFDETLHRDLLQVVQRLADDRSVRAAVWTSSGRVFSAGGDTDLILRTNQDMSYREAGIREGIALFRAFLSLTKPLVVALHGHSFGMASTFMMTADAIVAHPDALIADTHVKFGLVAGDGGCVVWPAQLPMIKAKRHLLTGTPLRADEAHRYGVVTDLVPSAEDVRARALEIGAEFAALPPLGVQLTKQALNQAVLARANEVFELSVYLEAITSTSSDVVEAVTAFKEKRPGVWRGE